MGLQKNQTKLSDKITTNIFMYIFIYIYLYIHTYISSNDWEVIEKSEKETRVINVVMDSSWPQK